MPRVEPPPSEDCACPRCVRIFSSEAAFDLHRQAVKGHPLDIHCVDPERVDGLARHVGPERWGLTEDVSPEWCGPFVQLELDLFNRTRKSRT